MFGCGVLSRREEFRVFFRILAGRLIFVYLGFEMSFEWAVVVFVFRKSIVFCEFWERVFVGLDGLLSRFTLGGFRSSGYLRCICSLGVFKYRFF